MDRGTCWAVVHEVAKGRPQLSSLAQVNHILFTQLKVLACPPNTYSGIISLKEIPEIL